MRVPTHHLTSLQFYYANFLTSFRCVGTRIGASSLTDTNQGGGKSLCWCRGFLFELHVLHSCTATILFSINKYYFEDSDSCFVIFLIFKGSAKSLTDGLTSDIDLTSKTLKAKSDFEPYNETLQI